MAVVTISRGSASGGLLLAEKLGEKLGYDIVSREDVIREAARFGASEESLQEALLKPPSFWDRFRHERRRYLAFVQAALCERAQKDRIIYHGNAGHLLLRRSRTCCASASSHRCRSESGWSWSAST